MAKYDIKAAIKQRMAEISAITGNSPEFVTGILINLALNSTDAVKLGAASRLGTYLGMDKQPDANPSAVTQDG